MGRLIYTAITSLDGYVNDAAGGFDWSAPDAEVHTFVNDLERDVATYLYGRRLYEVMAAWETTSTDPDQGAETADYARIWQSADKIVYSASQPSVNSKRTRVVSAFEPAEVRALKEAHAGALSIGGPTLAATALRAGLVDEIRLLLSPVVVGGGTSALPADLRLDLELLDQRMFRHGVVYLAYRLRT